MKVDDGEIRSGVDVKAERAVELNQQALDGSSNAQPSDSAIRQSGSPIADLTYRTYDGPLYSHVNRWWIIAVARIRYLRSRPWFWLLFISTMLPYFALGLILYVNNMFGGANPQRGGPMSMFLDDTVGQKYANLFLQAMSWQGFWLFLMALAAGAGSIAMDNRTNALQVYLSKPITKADYLLGKWMGIFLTVSGTMLVPALIFYIYCLLSYTGDGFLTNEPWLIVRVVVAAMVPGIIHASLLVGFSAWSKTPVIAGVFYSGFYFLTLTVSFQLWQILHRARPQEGVLLQHLSVGGVMGGLERNFLGVTAHWTRFFKREGEVRHLVIAPPDLKILLILAVVFCLAGILAARMRIRAVEVVRG